VDVMKKDIRNNLEYMNLRLEQFYRAQKTALTKREKKYIETPTQELCIELAELRGVLRGIQKSIDCLNERMNDNELPLVS
jgi:hypothetical protein